ncbi:unnamed protein product [Camellia sinensis]
MHLGSAKKIKWTRLNFLRCSGKEKKTLKNLMIQFGKLQVNKLMDRVEATFIKHFSNSNRSKGMNILRPKVKKGIGGTVCGGPIW